MGFGIMSSQYVSPCLKFAVRVVHVKEMLLQRHCCAVPVLQELVKNGAAMNKQLKDRMLTCIFGRLSLPTASCCTFSVSGHRR